MDHPKIDLPHPCIFECVPCDKSYMPPLPRKDKHSAISASLIPI